MATVDFVLVLVCLFGQGASRGSPDVHANLRVDSVGGSGKINATAEGSRTSQQGSWDLVLVHCREEYNASHVKFDLTSDVQRRRNMDQYKPGEKEAKDHGDRHGFSWVVDDFTKNPEHLGFRKTLVYEKCGSRTNFGEKVTKVQGRQPELRTDFGHRNWIAPYELTYLQHILENYDDLADWTVFLHGFPEDHNRHLAKWLDAFRRPTTSDAVYIPFGIRWFDREIGLIAQKKLQIYESMKVNGQEQQQISCIGNAEFMVSKSAIRQRDMKFWKNLENVFFKEEALNKPPPEDAQPPQISSENAQPARPPQIEARVSADAAEAARSLYPAIEIAWPVIFGRPPLDTKPNETFYCEWFEKGTLSPCGGGTAAFDSCWHKSDMKDC